MNSIKQFGVVILLLFGPVMTEQAFAENMRPGFGLGLRGGPAIPTQDPAQGAGADNGVFLDLHLLYGVTQHFTIGLTASGGGVDVTNLTFGSTTVSQDVAVGTYLVTLEYHPLLGRASPYAVLGAGLSRYNFDAFGISNALCQSLFGINCEIDEVDTLAVKGGAGLDLFLTSHLALSAELAWVYNRPADTEMKVGGSSQGTRTIHLSMLTAVFGIRYYF